jgi:hypothetical protein
MARAGQQRTENCLDWEETAITGPGLAFHAGCVVGKSLYNTFTF